MKNNSPDLEYQEQSPVYKQENETGIEKTIDDAGIEREIINFGKTKLIFVGREELPLVPGFEHSHRLGGDEKPRLTEQTTKSTESINNGNFLVNITPLGFVEAALALGLKDESFIRMREDIKKGLYTEEVLSLIDTIVACHIVNDSGRVGETYDTQAEVLVLKSLLGDQQAISEVKARVEALRQHDTDTRALNMKYVVDRWGKFTTSAERLDENDLLLVRRTGHRPSRLSDGTIFIQCLSEGTDRVGARGSIHFTLDFPVISHSDGSWDDLKYTIVGTYGDVTGANSRQPYSLDPSDTWFNQNPGEILKLPNAIVFEADVSHDGAPVTIDGFVVYNPKTTSLEDLVAGVRSERGIKNNGSMSFSDNITYWTDKEKLAKLRHLAITEGILVMSHNGSSQNDLEGRLATSVANAGTDGTTFTSLLDRTLKIDWRLLEPITSLAHLLADSPIEQRRNYYASGLALPRNAKPRIHRGGL